MAENILGLAGQVRFNNGDETYLLNNFESISFEFHNEYDVKVMSL